MAPETPGGGLRSWSCGVLLRFGDPRRRKVEPSAARREDPWFEDDRHVQQADALVSRRRTHNRPGTPLLLAARRRPSLSSQRTIWAATVCQALLLILLEPRLLVKGKLHASPGYVLLEDNCVSACEATFQKLTRGIERLVGNNVTPATFLDATLADCDTVLSLNTCAKRNASACRTNRLTDYHQSLQFSAALCMCPCGRHFAQGALNLEAYGGGDSYGGKNLTFDQVCEAYGDFFDCMDCSEKWKGCRRGFRFVDKMRGKGAVDPMLILSLGKHCPKPSCLRNLWQLDPTVDPPAGTGSPTGGRLSGVARLLVSAALLIAPAACVGFPA